MKELQIWTVLGWEPYPWASGIQSAKAEYRRVREIEFKEEDEDPYKIKILRSWRDGKRTK